MNPSRGSADLEKRSIFCRLLAKRLRDRTDQDDIDLSSLSLVAVGHVDKGQADLGLGDRVGLKGMTEAGSADKKDPRWSMPSPTTRTHRVIADCFWSDAPGRPVLILALAKAFHELVTEVASACGPLYKSRTFPDAELHVFLGGLGGGAGRCPRDLIARRKLGAKPSPAASSEVEDGRDVCYGWRSQQQSEDRENPL